MKLVFLVVFLIFLFCVAVVAKWNWRKLNLWAIGVILVLFFAGYLVAAGVSDSTAIDTWCLTKHTPVQTMERPLSPTTAEDFFIVGNYDFETGQCAEAVVAYSRSIKLDPKSAETFNNRAYAQMRLRNYAAALPDLDKAIELRPDYVNALMNRGDIRNYYFDKNFDLAVADYQKVIALGGASSTSVCGHMILARNHGWNLHTFFDILTRLVLHFPNMRTAGC